MSRRFGSNIVVDGSVYGDAARTQNYESVVHGLLIGLLGFDTGRAVIEMIWSKSRRLTVRPWRSHQVNADSNPLSDRAGTAPFQPVRSGTDGHHNAAWGFGTGAGSSAVVRYTPSMWSDDAFEWDGAARNTFAAQTGWWPPDPGADAGEVLFHEMVHALRAMSGVENRMAMGRQFDTREEFVAVLVTNIYTSERGRFAWLRADHGATRLLSPGDWRTDPEMQALIRGISTSEPGLVLRLARVSAPFNPFAGRYGD